MADNELEAIRHAQGSRLLVETDRVSYGITRVYKTIDDAASPNAEREVAEEREYRIGDEDLVASGKAEWVVAPVHSKDAGRRLDSAPGAAEEFRKGFDENGPVKEDKSAADKPAAKSATGGSNTGTKGQ